MTEDRDLLQNKVQNLIENSELVQKNRLAELTNKFEVFVTIMANFAEIDKIIENQIECIKILR